MVETGIDTYIKKFCEAFADFIKYLNIIDDFISKKPIYYIIFNILFVTFTSIFIGGIFLLKYALNFNINALLIITRFFNFQLEIAFSTFFVTLLLITLSKSYSNLNNPNILTENVWVKSSLFFMSKLYSLIFIVFVLGIFKGIVYIFALRENQNKPELHYPILVIIFSIIIFINILLPLLLSLYSASKEVTIDKCIGTIFQLLISISLVGLIVYYICKALQNWVASSILSTVKMILNINNDFNPSCENFTNKLSSPISFCKKTENDKFIAYKKSATDIINFVMVCLIFLALLFVKCNPRAHKLESIILNRIDDLAYETQSILFQSKQKEASVGGRRAKKKK